MMQYVTDEGKNNQIDIHKSVKRVGNLKVIVKGDNNHITIGEGCILNSGIVECLKNDSVILVGRECKLNGNYRCRVGNTRIEIAEECTFNGIQMTLHEPGAIYIGRDCMFSGQITMDVSDMHGIFDANSGERLNHPGDIVLEEHVWVCQGVTLMKGVTVGRDSVLGAKSLVTTDVPSGVVVGGVPAKILKKGIIWDRNFTCPSLS